MKKFKNGDVVHTFSKEYIEKHWMPNTTWWKPYGNFYSPLKYEWTLWQTNNCCDREFIVRVNHMTEAGDAQMIWVTDRFGLKVESCFTSDMFVEFYGTFEDLL